MHTRSTIDYGLVMIQGTVKNKVEIILTTFKFICSNISCIVKLIKESAMSSIWRRRRHILWLWPENLVQAQTSSTHNKLCVILQLRTYTQTHELLVLVVEAANNYSRLTILAFISFIFRAPSQQLTPDIICNFPSDPRTHNRSTECFYWIKVSAW